MLWSASIATKWVVLDAAIRGIEFGGGMEHVVGEMVEANSSANVFEVNRSVGGLEKAGSEIVARQFM
jgi:hypothetical protein